MTAASTRFALRMPIEMKEAAVALARAQFLEEEPGGFIVASPGSINEAVNFLMRYGLAEVLRFLIDARVSELHHLNCWRDVMKTQLANPDADATSLELYRPGSLSRSAVEDLMADGGRWSDDKIRGRVAWLFGAAQRQLHALTVAKTAVLTAIDRPPDRRARRSAQPPVTAEVQRNQALVADLLKNSIATTKYGP